jgi:HD-GYP domain-containing protein (c-di-GMP phosphodiesterase class II)
MGFDERLQRDLELGALLHDVGKIVIPNEILNKPGKLDAEEWAIVKTHTVEGQRMLERVGGTLAEAGKVVRSHHERWDGGGYPDGVPGDEIPLAARVICVCDAYHAMTSDRAYRKAMPVEAAIEELRANAGTQFDPAVVEALVAVVAPRSPRSPRGPKLGPECSTSSQSGSRRRSRASARAAS